MKLKKDESGLLDKNLVKRNCKNYKTSKLELASSNLMQVWWLTNE